MFRTKLLHLSPILNPRRFSRIPMALEACPRTLVAIRRLAVSTSQPAPTMPQSSSMPSLISNMGNRTATPVRKLPLRNPLHSPSHNPPPLSPRRLRHSRCPSRRWTLSPPSPPHPRSFRRGLRRLSPSTSPPSQPTPLPLPRKSQISCCLRRSPPLPLRPWRSPP